VRQALREPPIEGRGLRVLAMDGGGMKGLAMVQILRALERRMCRPLHTVFDLVVGAPLHAGVPVYHQDPGWLCLAVVCGVAVCMCSGKAGE